MRIHTVLIVFLCSFIATSIGCSEKSLSSDTGRHAVISSSPIQISRPGMVASEPGIAAGPDGRLFVVWAEHDDDRADVFVRSIEPGEPNLREPVRVNPVLGQAKAWFGDPPTIKVGDDGTVYVGWTAKLDQAGAKGNDLSFPYHVMLGNHSNRL